MVCYLQVCLIRFYNEDVAIHSRESGGESTMGLFIAAAVLTACFLASWAILRRPVRRMVEDVRIEHARALFHRNRERLEARFLSALDRTDPTESELWETAHWHDDVLWARDRQTNHLLALTCVEFEPEPFELSSEQRHATAIFEFHNGHWCAQGKHFDELRPDEAIDLFRRLETV
jgi:hypothetical protein